MARVTWRTSSSCPIKVLACGLYAIQPYFIVLLLTNHRATIYSVVVVKMQIARIFATSWKSWKKIFCCVPPTTSVFSRVSSFKKQLFWFFWREKMPETTVEDRDVLEAVETGGRRKKARFPSQWSSTTTPHQRTLELEGVIEVLREYDSVEGNDINCSICGKNFLLSCCKLWVVISVA